MHKFVWYLGKIVANRKQYITTTLKRTWVCNSKWPKWHYTIWISSRGIIILTQIRPLQTCLHDKMSTWWFQAVIEIQDIFVVSPPSLPTFTSILIILSLAYEIGTLSSTIHCVIICTISHQMYLNTRWTLTYINELGHCLDLPLHICIGPIGQVLLMKESICMWKHISSLRMFNPNVSMVTLGIISSWGIFLDCQPEASHPPPPLSTWNGGFYVFYGGLFSNSNISKSQCNV